MTSTIRTFTNSTRRGMKVFRAGRLLGCALIAILSLNALFACGHDPIHCLDGNGHPSAFSATCQTPAANTLQHCADDCHREPCSDLAICTCNLGYLLAPRNPFSARQSVPFRADFDRETGSIEKAVLAFSPGTGRRVLPSPSAPSLRAVILLL